MFKRTIFSIKYNDETKDKRQLQFHENQFHKEGYAYY